MLTPRIGWLRLVGSLKLQVSFTKYSIFYRALLQKRPITSLIILVAATPYRKLLTPCIEIFHSLELNRDYRCEKTVRVWWGSRITQKNCYELDRKFLYLRKSCRRNTGVRIYWDVGGSRVTHRTEYSYTLHIKHWYTLHRKSHYSTHRTFVHPTEKLNSVTLYKSCCRFMCICM